MIALVQLKAEFTKFILYLFTRRTSAFLIILGRRELGKTDFALLTAEILYASGKIKHFATNIGIKNSNVPFVKITNLDDLRFWCENNAGRKVFYFDELGKSLRRRSPMSSLNIHLIDEFQILRKYKLSVFACTMSDKLVDRAILGEDVLDGYFVKKEFYKELKRNQKIALYTDYLEGFTKTIDGIPPTSIEFDTWGTAPFTEHGAIVKPNFKNKDMAALWDWSHGTPVKDLPINRMSFLRLKKKFVKEVLERERNK